MVKQETDSRDDSIDLKTIFRLFLKRKWWFIGAFMIVFLLGIIYTWSKPVLYEVRYKFSFEDDFIPDDFLIYDNSQQLYDNQSVFIGAKDVGLIFNTELIVRSLEDIEEIGKDYKDYISTSLKDLELEDDTSIFTLKIKNSDKKLANQIAKTLIESLGTQVMKNDIEIFKNTLTMIEADVMSLESENNRFEAKIKVIDEEIQDMYKELGNILEEEDSSILNGLYYDILEKKGEILINRAKISDNEEEITKLNILHQKYGDEMEKVHNRVEIISANPDYNIENDRLINSLIVILLSLLTGIVVVLIVNYIYKLKAK